MNFDIVYIDQMRCCDVELCVEIWMVLIWVRLCCCCCCVHLNKVHRLKCLDHIVHLVHCIKMSDKPTNRMKATTKKRTHQFLVILKKWIEKSIFICTMENLAWVYIHFVKRKKHKKMYMLKLSDQSVWHNINCCYCLVWSR